VQTGDRLSLVIHLALYVIESAEDALEAGRSDVFDFESFECECENCGMVIGPVADDVFFPCVVILDTEETILDDRWAICVDCASPLLYPNEWVINLDI